MNENQGYKMREVFCRFTGNQKIIEFRPCFFSNKCQYGNDDNPIENIDQVNDNGEHQ